MKINRFSTVQAAQYNPMSLEELMMVPQYKRQSHDALLEGINDTQTQLAQVDADDMHSEVVMAEKARMEEMLNAQVDRLSSEGFTHTAKPDIMELNKQYQQSMGPNGTLGRAAAAKVALGTERDTYIANATKMGYSPDQAAVNWETHKGQYQSKYGETGKISNIDPLYAPNYKNVVDEFNTLAKDAGLSSRDIANLNSTIVFDSAKGSYVVNKGDQTVNADNIEQLQAAADWITNNVKNPNSELAQSLDHQGMSADDAIAQITGLNKVYQKDSFKESKTNTITSFSPASKLGVTGNAELAYEVEDAEAVTVFQNDFTSAISELEASLRGDVTSNLTNTNYVSGLGASTSISANTTNDQLSMGADGQVSGEFKDDYMKILDHLTEGNDALKKLSPTSQEAIDLVKGYVETNNNILRQNIIITDDINIVYGENSVGTSKSDPAKVAQAVSNNRLERQYYIEGSDAPVAYDDLPSEIKENFETMTYGGYYSPKNFLTYTHGKFANKNMFVSPLKMQYVDDSGKVTKLMVSRSGGEMKQKGYIADTEFNDVFVNTNRMPGIPYRPKFKGHDSAYTITYVNAPGQTGYLIKGKDGTIFKNEEELQTLMYRMNGVTRSEKE